MASTFAARTAGKRALAPSASETMAGCSLTFFSGMSRSWNSLASCLH
eukprot:CAMPEP_0184250934 /NCGR_PEP_ID=MMETSP0977-20130417/4927_1 /TAXON_ID=483370 /ORGANISM="non described non described, Strain CCMP2097" /LENGTH=46 /DNA_ID= /DNA_START= /DNA_END= /DNA_ORIENTATION=